MTLAPSIRPPSEAITSRTAYRDGHTQVLRSIRRIAGRDARHLDAVVVPTNRPLKGLPGLELAASVARERSSHLVVLCSGRAKAEDFPSHLSHGLKGLVAVRDVGVVPPRSLPVMSTSQLPMCWKWRKNDVGVKRNLGLALAVMAGWEHVLFLDDDVSPHDGPTLDGAGIENAMAEFGADSSLGAVGWTLQDFHDNSVVGHARRRVGMRQDVFIGGAALAVRCGIDVPFFPQIYNEDWLFLIALAAGAVRRRGSVATAGRLRQMPYDPFQQSRAQSEEAGDVLAEGLMNVLEDDGPGLWSAYDERFWDGVLKDRQMLLGRLVGRLPDAREATALQAALDVNQELTAADLVEFVRCWKNDLQCWADHLTALRERASSRRFIGENEADMILDDLLAPDESDMPVFAGA